MTKYTCKIHCLFGRKILNGMAAAILILTFLCVYVVSELCDMGHVEDVEIQKVIVHQLTENRFSCKVYYLLVFKVKSPLDLT